MANIQTETNQKLVLRRFAASIQEAHAIEQAPLDSPDNGEVLIRNCYVGINPIFDREVVNNRVPHRPSVIGQTLGVEAVGEVVAVGDQVESVQVGEAVSTVNPGTAYQRYQISPEKDLVKIPAATPEYLALFPTGVSGMVALQQVAQLASGEVCILSAAAGGLGHIVLQLIKRQNNHLIAVCGGAEKARLCKDLGADRVIDYKAEDINEVLAREYPQGVNLAYDSVGQKIFDTFVDHLAVRGRLVVSGYAADFAQDTPESVLQQRIYTKLYWKAASIRGFMNPLFPEHQGEARKALVSLYQSGELKVVIDRQRFCGIESIVEASEYLLAGRSCGKVVVQL